MRKIGRPTPAVQHKAQFSHVVLHCAFRCRRAHHLVTELTSAGNVARLDRMSAASLLSESSSSRDDCRKSLMACTISDISRALPILRLVKQSRFTRSRMVLRSISICLREGGVTLHATVARVVEVDRRLRALLAGESPRCPVGGAP